MSAGAARAFDRGSNGAQREFCAADGSFAIRITTDLEFLRREFRRVATNPAENAYGGLLIGSATTAPRPAIAIDSFIWLPPESSAEGGAAEELSLLAESRRGSVGAGGCAVGYYRIQPAHQDLGEADRLLLSRSFSGPAVALGIDPARPTAVRAFLWLGPQMPVRAFDLDLAENEPAPASVHSGFPLTEKPPAPWRVFDPRWMIALALAAFLVASGFLIYRGATGGSAAIADGAQSEAGLDLKLERVGLDYRLTWDRRSAAVLSAQGAVLSIWERNERKDLRIDTSQLRSGMLLYTPVSSEVTFQLEIFGPQSGPVTESVRAISGMTVGMSPGQGAPSGVWPASRPQSRNTSSVAAQPPAQEAQAEPSTSAVKEFRPPPAPANANLAAATPPPEITLERSAQVLNAPPVSGRPASPPIPEAPRPPAADSAQTGSNGQQAPSSVATSTGFEPPKPVKRTLPELSQFVRKLVRGQVEVPVTLSIDETGRVIETVAEKGVPELLARAARNAAESWRFAPAKLNGKEIPSTFTVKFQFREATR